MPFVKLSQLGGLVNELVEKIGSWFENVASWMMDTIVTAIFTWVYTTMCIPVLMIIEVIGALFRKFAGLGTYFDKNLGQTVEGDFVYSLMTSDAVMNVFWAMLILAVVLLVITTFIAVVKSEFASFGDKGENNKSKIIATSIRALVNFAVVPVCAVLGIMIGNALLRTIDGATGGGEAFSLGGRVFVASAYDANRIRRCNNGDSEPGSVDWALADYLSEKQFGREYKDLTDTQKQELAEFVDYQFETGGLSTVITGDTVEDLEFTFINDYSYLRIDGVVGYYNLSYFSFFLFLLASVGVTIMMLFILIGLIKRIFAIVTLFVAAPPIVALSPLKPDALKEWNKLFVKNVLAAYSSIVCMNIYLLIMKAFSNIDFFPEIPELFGMGTISWAFNQIAFLLILIGGLVFVKDITKDIAGIIGGDSAMSEGAGKAKEFGEMAGNIGTLGLGLATLPGRALRTVGRGVGAVGKGLGAAVSKTRIANKAQNAISSSMMPSSNPPRLSLGNRITLGMGNAIMHPLDTVKNAGKAIKKGGRAVGRAVTQISSPYKNFFKSAINLTGVPKSFSDNFGPAKRRKAERERADQERAQREQLAREAERDQNLANMIASGIAQNNQTQQQNATQAQQNTTQPAQGATNISQTSGSTQPTETYNWDSVGEPIVMNVSYEKPKDPKRVEAGKKAAETIKRKKEEEQAKQAAQQAELQRLKDENAALVKRVNNSSRGTAKPERLPRTYSPHKKYR